MTQQIHENVELIDPRDNFQDISFEIPGKTAMWDSSQNQRIVIDGNGNISLRGSNGKERAFLSNSGKIYLRDFDGNTRAFISDRGQISLQDSNGNTRIFISYSGNIILRDSNGKKRAEISDSGKIWLRDSNGNQRAFIGITGQYLMDSSGTLRAEMRSTSGQIFLRDSNGNARAFMGGDGNIRLWDSSQNESVTIHGNTGDIILRNADAAEHFDVADAVTVEPGMIMALDEDGKLKPSSTPYDRKAVGVISGLGDHRPGIIMDNRECNGKRIPVSVLGKVSCKADATHAPIEFGDLLTTSQTIGHAMKATDLQKSFGSIIGKALSQLSEGFGLVNMLVTLQ